MVGFAYTPVTGGLFLGSEALGALTPGRFPVTQDQRNTFSCRATASLTKRIWTAVDLYYGTGLPMEFDGKQQEAIQEYGAAIVNRVNFARGRVRPDLAVGASVGAEMMKHETFTLRLQADVRNLNNRINVINFAGLFSGTGIAPPRSAAVRLELLF